MPEGQARAGTNHASLKQRVRHAGDGLHGENGVADGRGGNVVLAQRTQDAELPKVLEAIKFVLGNQSGSFPGLQLTGTELKDAQNILTAIAGHSGVLLQVMLHPSDNFRRPGSRCG
ncbi:hypothetical protein SBA5_250106 [Candidatus Sulfotelmatomonas gaucii]|uniref:Uncharacterized protein n=1 Tax=Candidatus Sulfuritelmatomonas gaucii TaxID=2043161 RepID=A0A2N9L9C8_9BACT|nr:hypothetical protein SBA5_250106 [Candidatus Sulfotelmatomonas gaucii]